MQQSEIRSAETGDSRLLFEKVIFSAIENPD
jgi:hypothetical protein